MLKTIFIICILYSINSFSQQIGKYPPSRRYAPIVSNIDEQLFNHIISELKDIYVTQDGLSQITFDPHWENSFTVAYSSHRENQWIVYVNGGMARAPHMTPDAFRMLLCHEVGHLIGGAPFALVNRWAAVEGQADYFAASKCMKRVLGKMRNLKVEEPIPSELKEKCKQVYTDHKQQIICMRTISAGKHLIDAFAYMLAEEPASLSSSDNHQVQQTIIDDYPSIQCRLDTVIAGSICNIDPIGNISSTSAHANACTAQNGDSIGLRPACWFNESEFY